MGRKSPRLYSDLAWLWPLWESVDVYQRESEIFARLIRKHGRIRVHTLLDVGCGGGKNAFHLKRHFKVTGIDKSNAMLANAKKLNPECDFHRKDMRNFNLDRQFDSVFINDAITYMKTERELRRVFGMAYKHLRPGGVMISYPDRCEERFNQNETTVWTSKRRGMDLTFVENNYDPNPKDQTYESTFVYLIRTKGKLRIEHDFHVCGLFALDVWRRLLGKAGFEVTEVKNREFGDIPVFVCLKPT
jgi:SAM-dependent methyltransferase